jgi:tRNA(adenine34) deaminase
MQAIPRCPFQPFAENYDEANRQYYFMCCAFNEALLAWEQGEIPIGAVAVVENQIVARAHNQVEQRQDATAHAEMEIIRFLSNSRKDWRLKDVHLYVTKEPCPMCSGAIYKARIPKVTIGAYDTLQGCLGGRVHFNNILHLYHKVDVCIEPLQGLCEELINTFFKLRRNM